MLGVKKNELVMVAVMLSGTLLAVLNMTFLSPALPTIMADMGVSQTTVQWLTSGYSLTEAVIIPLSAFLMSRLSTRKMFIGGISLFAAGSLTAALSPSFPFLLAGRIMQAICTGAIMPMVFSVILMIFPRERRGSAMGVIGLVIGFAPAIGPSLSGVIVDRLGWHDLFGIVTALALVVLVLAIVFLRNYGEFHPVKLDSASPVLSSVGLLCLLYGLSTFSSTSNLPLTIGLIVVGLAVLALFVRRQLTLEEPMLRVGILRTRRYATAVTVIAFVQMALVGTEVVTPLFVQGVRGYGATTSGLLMLPGAVLGAIVGFFAGRLFDRLGVRKLAIPGGILMVAGAVGMAMLNMNESLALVCLTFTVLDVGLQFIITPLNTWGINSLANEDIPHAQGVGNTINQVAGSFGTAILVSLTAMGWVIEPGATGVEATYAGIHLAYMATAALLTVAFLIVVFRVRDARGAAPQAATEAGRAADGARGRSDERAQAPAGDRELDGRADSQVRALVAPEGFGTSVLAHVGSVAGDYAGSVHGMADRTSSWTVADVMNRDPHYVSERASMADVVRLMAATDTSGVPLVDGDLRVVGFVSDGDVAKYLGRNDVTIFDRAHNLYQMFDDPVSSERLSDLFSLNVMDIATRNVICAKSTDALDAACDVLSERRIKKMPVVQDGRLVGSLSRRNVMHSLSLALQDVEPARGE
ncbi:MAG: MDR family MFS transporter [Coriobacteriales bacterium]|jgi:DHA2 family multidrug resistance protein-like MFS transporter